MKLWLRGADARQTSGVPALEDSIGGGLPSFGTACYAAVCSSLKRGLEGLTHMNRRAGG